jgi:kynurenine formamidase
MAERIDLSFPLSPDMPRWKVRFEDVPNVISYKLSEIHLPVHCATHLDAPLHYIWGGPAIETFPLEMMVSEACVLDLTAVQENECIGPEHLSPVLSAGHPATVLLCTGWPRRAWRTPTFWERSPWVSAAAAVWLADHGATMVGYDFPQEYAIRDIARGTARMADFTVHLELLSRGVWQLEYLANLDRLPPRVRLYVFPLNLVGVEASPVRVVAEGL